ncbi:MAG TPA: hypothetical protein VGD84_22615, partial [Pseudonocardiaceae bacterium]
AAHRPLLAMISNFLIRVLVEVELELFPEERTDSGADVRAEIVDAMRRRDGSALQAAIRAYHSDAADGFMKLTLSDQRLTGVLARLNSRA